MVVGPSSARGEQGVGVGVGEGSVGVGGVVGGQAGAERAVGGQHVDVGGLNSVAPLLVAAFEIGRRVGCCGAAQDAVYEGGSFEGGPRQMRPAMQPTVLVGQCPDGGDLGWVDPASTPACLPAELPLGRPFFPHEKRRPSSQRITLYPKAARATVTYGQG